MTANNSDRRGGMVYLIEELWILISIVTKTFAIYVSL